MSTCEPVASASASLRALLNDYFAQSEDVIGLLSRILTYSGSVQELKALLARDTPEDFRGAIDDDDTADDSKDAAQFSLLLEACRRDGVKSKYIKQYLNPLLEDE